jgi:hypothetical protein
MGPVVTRDAGEEVLARRRRASKLARSGQRLGYALFSAAIAAFLAGFFTGFEDWTAVVVSVALITGSVVLAPSIVIAYGVKAAEREDRQRPGR